MRNWFSTCLQSFLHGHKNSANWGGSSQPPGYLSYRLETSQTPWNNPELWLRGFIWPESVRNWLRYRYSGVTSRWYSGILVIFHPHWTPRTYAMTLKWKDVIENNLLQHSETLFRPNRSMDCWDTGLSSFSVSWIWGGIWSLSVLFMV